MVKGANASPLYKHLTSKETNPKSSGDVKWNFTKFLLGKNGEILGRFESSVELDDASLVGAVEAALKK
jgi:glutathione peroxidase